MHSVDEDAPPPTLELGDSMKRISLNDSSHTISRRTSMKKLQRQSSVKSIQAGFDPQRIESMLAHINDVLVEHESMMQYPQ